MDFTELTKKVKEAAIGTGRMTDVKNGVYHIDPSGKNICLVSEKKQRIAVTENALAALRIVESSDSMKDIVTTRDARNSEAFKNLQDAVEAESVKLSADTKFEVVGHLRILDITTDKPTYRNECYKGYPSYVKASRIAAAMPHATDEQTSARNLAFSEASEELHTSGLKPSITEEDKNLMLIPVFKVKA